MTDDSAERVTGETRGTIQQRGLLGRHEKQFSREGYWGDMRGDSAKILVHLAMKHLYQVDSQSSKKHFRKIKSINEP